MRNLRKTATCLRSGIVGVLVCSFAIASCTGPTGPTGPSGAVTVNFPSSAAPALTASPTSLTLTGAGATGGFTASETGYAGTITAANGTPTCAGIATFSPASGTGPVATFVVTAVAAGICQIKVTDANGQAAAVLVTVNTASSSGSALTTSTSSLAFTVAGSAQTFTANESGYSGPLTAANGSPSCAGIATFSPASGTGPGVTFTVTAVAAGTCTIVVSDNHGGSASVGIIVTTTSGTIN